MDNIIKLTGFGTIQFDPKPYSNKQIKHKEKNIYAAMLNTNDDLAEYYAWFYKKRFNIELLKLPRKAHITFLNDVILDMETYELVKDKWNKQKIEFIYKPTQLRSEQGSWWIRCECPVLDQIRSELGLGPYKFGYHITIGKNHPLFTENFNYNKIYNTLYERD